MPVTYTIILDFFFQICILIMYKYNKMLNLAIITQKHFGSNTDNMTKQEGRYLSAIFTAFRCSAMIFRHS